MSEVLERAAAVVEGAGLATKTESMQFRLNDGSPNKLTDWVKEPTIQELKQDLEAAKPSQGAHMARISGWNDQLKVQGSAKPPKVKGRSSVQPKLIRRQAEWRYSALTEPFLSSQKLFKVNPVTFEDAPAAKQNELVLNWQFRTKMNKVQFIDDYVRACVDEGTVIVRTGWKRHTVMLKKTVPTFEHYEIENEEQAQALQAAIQMKEENPREYEEDSDPAVKAAVDYLEESGTGTYAVQVGEEEVEYEKVLQNHPTAEVMNPNNVFIDPSCQGDIDRALFGVASFETNQAELRKDKKYKNLDRVNWEGASVVTNPEHVTTTPNDFQMRDPMRKRVVAYEYWGFYDINDDGTLVPIVATWIEDVLIRLDLNPYPDQKIPFVLTTYLPVKRDLYGEPDAELLGENQQILGATTRGIIDLLGRSANGQQGFAKGMLDPLNKRRFERGEDYEFNPSTHPTQGHIEHTYPEIPQSAMLMLSLQNQEAEALTGVKSFSGGISGESYGDVAAGIRGVLDAAGKREMGILRRLAKGMTDVGNKFIAMNGEFMSEEETIRVTNDTFVKVKRDELIGNFDLETDISTTEVDNAKAQDLGFMLQTIGPNTDPSIVMMILAEIAELKRMPELAEKLRRFRPQPSPEQAEMQKLEIEEKKAEIAKLQSEVKLNEAKAAKELAQKDNLDLEFVEQETGTNHARDMEKQEAQSKGNQKLEITKGLLKPRKRADGQETDPDIEAAIGWNALSDKLGKGDAPTGVGTAAGAGPVLREGELPDVPLGSPAMAPPTALNPALDPALVGA